MLKNIFDVMNNINSNELDIFLSSTNANYLCISDIKETKIDYSWLDVLEDTLDNIDNIVRNPKTYLIQEEDVLNVEQTKKISQETIKHLASHSGNIQSIDENEEVVPKKLLNVYKEDTADLYENRFIYTLILRLENFINRQLDILELTSNKEIKRKVSYKANTVLKNKKINIELKMDEEENQTLDESFLNYKDRILYCYEIICSFKQARIIKELVGCSLVSNPIRKTNLILRHPDFQKANILWQYLDNFEYNDPKTVTVSRNIDSSKEVKDEFSLSYFIDCNAIDDSKENFLKYKNFDEKLKKLLNEYVYEDNQNMDEFTLKVNDYYNEALNNKNDRINNIIKIYDDFIKNHYNKIDSLYKIFE